MIVDVQQLPLAEAPIPSSDERLEAMHRRALRSFKPPPRLSMSQWAEQKFFLSAESAAEPGRWRTIPYQRGILNAFTDPLVERISVMKSARVGYTKCLNIAVGYHIEHDPCPILIVQPTIDDAEGYSKEEIAPMLRDCPSLTHLVSDAKAKDSDNTILRKLFRGGSLTMVGANSARGFRRTSRRVLLLDEVDGYPLSAGTEGDPIRLAEKRTEYYWNRKIAAGSTPTTAGRSRIEKLFEAGDQRRYYVPCPHCGHMAYLVFRPDATDRRGDPVGHFMEWPSNRPKEAHFVCRECGSHIDHQRKREMVEGGEWRAGAAFDGHASFHIWAGYSYSPNATWAHLASEFVEAHKNGIEELKTFVNTGLGETWKEKGEAPDWERLYLQREHYELGACPAGVLFLTAGVDVQKDRLIYEVVGWGRGKASWSIDIGIIPGDPSDATSTGPWDALDGLLARQFSHVSGAQLPIGMMAVDSGYATQSVYNWVRLHPMSRVIATKGTDRSKTIVGSPSAVDVNYRGVKIANGCKVWPVGVSIVKGELYGWLKLKRPTTEGIVAGAAEPPGACHFPEHGEEFFKQLTAETLVSHRHRGMTIFEWQLVPGRENHHLDTRVYARAAAAVLGLDRFKESDWRTFEHAIANVPQTDPNAPQGEGSQQRRVSRSKYLG